MHGGPIKRSTVSLPEVANFLVGKLSDDVADQWIEIGYLCAEGRRTAHGEFGCHLVQAMAQGAKEEELGLQVLQVQWELEQVDVRRGERDGSSYLEFRHQGGRGCEEEEEEEEEGGKESGRESCSHEDPLLTCSLSGATWLLFPYIRVAQCYAAGSQM